jgi:2-haloacid dehalogenase
LIRVSARPEGVEAVVFDLGGVLIDWDPRHLYRKIFADEHEVDDFLSTIATPEWHSEQDRGRPMEEATALLLSRYPQYAPEIEAYYGRWDEMFGGTIEDSVGVLRDVREEGYPLYALTNWSAETFPRARERWDFLGWFEDIVVSGEERAIKPDTEIYGVLVERTGLEPAKTVFIDDRGPNVRAAADLGFIAVEFEDAAQLRQNLVKLGVLPITSGSVLPDA